MEEMISLRRPKILLRRPKFVSDVDHDGGGRFWVSCGTALAATHLITIEAIRILYSVHLQLAGVHNDSLFDQRGIEWVVYTGWIL